MNEKIIKSIEEISRNLNIITIEVLNIKDREIIKKTYEIESKFGELIALMLKKTYEG